VLHPTFDADAASILINLPGYRVLSATEATADRPRAVLVESTDQQGACPSCGVLSSRVHSRPVEPVKDVSCGDAPLLVGIRKRRYTCTETRCPRKTFTEATEQLPSQARVTTRLATRVITALRAEPRAVSRVADETGLAWPTVMRLLAATVDLASGVDGRHVRRHGIDEHRFRTVKFVRDPDTAKVTRLEPWSIMFTGPDQGGQRPPGCPSRCRCSRPSPPGGASC